MQFFDGFTIWLLQCTSKNDRVIIIFIITTTTSTTTIFVGLIN